ncbi:hypothetical protein ACIOJD_16140 [Streptomyces sp. NPDC088116]
MIPATGERDSTGASTRAGPAWAAEGATVSAVMASSPAIMAAGHF